MSHYNTKTLIDSLQQRTENILQTAITEWQMMPSQKLLRQPAEKKWSAAQCMEHLNSYGRYYYPEIEKAIKKAKENNWQSVETFTSGTLGGYFTKMMEPKEDGKVKKMASPKDHSPVAYLNSDKVLAEFIDQQEKLLLLLEQARAVDLEKARVPISIARFIKLKLGDVFGFLIAHNNRHVLQAKRALATAGAEVNQQAYAVH